MRLILTALLVFCCQGSPDSDLLSFTRVKESRQRKHAPVKSLFFALFQFSKRQFAELATLKQMQIA